MARRLADKVALITGASSGIGRAAARLFAQEGAKVAGLARSPKELEAEIKYITESGGDAIPVVADISKPAQMKEAVQKVIDRWGHLEIVFANAGINGVWAPLEELSPEEWDRTIQINLNGTFYTVKYAAPYLKQQGGSVIITSSVNGTRIFSNTGATAYSCTKAAQVAFTKMVALELAEYRVRVNVICPGAIETQIGESTEKQDIEQAREPVRYPEGKIPLTDGKPGEPNDVAQLALFLASDASNHISGTEIWIDGTESLLMG
jgi:NAD(P)-dependent dehydrogenase (short-subunit alcohol dehydrogenase family)